MPELDSLSSDELLAELRRVQADLDDLQEVRLFTLSQTGVHLGAGRLQTLQHSWERDEARLQERIKEIKRRLP